MEFQKDIKAYSSGKCITQHKQLAFDFEISKTKKHQEKVCTQEKDMETTRRKCEE